MKVSYCHKNNESKYTVIKNICNSNVSRISVKMYNLKSFEKSGTMTSGKLKLYKTHIDYSKLYLNK